MLIFGLLFSLIFGLVRLAVAIVSVIVSILARLLAVVLRVVLVVGSKLLAFLLTTGVQIAAVVVRASWSFLSTVGVRLMIVGSRFVARLAVGLIHSTIAVLTVVVRSLIAVTVSVIQGIIPLLAIAISLPVRHKKATFVVGAAFIVSALSLMAPGVAWRIGTLFVAVIVMHQARKHLFGERPPVATGLKGIYFGTVLAFGILGGVLGGMFIPSILGFGAGAVGGLLLGVVLDLAVISPLKDTLIGAAGKPK